MDELYKETPKETEVKEEGFWDDLAIEDISKDLEATQLGKRKADGDLVDHYIVSRNCGEMNGPLP